MRRLLSILLLALFGLPVVAPALALGGDPTQTLPACCRRDGKHHCSGEMASASKSTAHTIGARCASYPQPPTSVSQHIHPAILPNTLLKLSFIVTPTPHQAAETRRRISQYTTRDNRGPPSLFLA